MIIETTANELYQVTEAGPGLQHVWSGIPVKLVKGAYVPKAKAKAHLVRKAGCKVVSQ